MRRSLLLLGLLTVGVAVTAPVAQATTPGGFTVARSANLGGVPAQLFDVTAPTPSSGWAIGSLRRRTHPKAPWALMEQWNGTSWSRIGLPSLPPTAYQTYLSSISSTTPTDAWAVGWSVTPKTGRWSATHHELVYRRTAAGWKRVTITDGPGGSGYNAVTSVSVASPTNVWALATDWDCEIYVLHYDGAHWSQVDREEECDAGSGNAYGQITATGASTAWAVGNGCSDYCDEAGAEVTCFGSSCPTDGGLRFVGGGGGNFWNSVGTDSDFWAIGYQQVDRSYAPLIWHWDGTAWTDETPSFTGTSDTLYGAVMLPDGDLWTVGYRTASGGDRTLLLQHSASGWAVLGVPNSGTADNTLSSIAHVGGTSTEMWAVGSAGAQPLLLHHA